jgi:hypothetical protein
MSITAIESNILRDLSASAIGLAHAARNEETTARNGRDACRSAAAFAKVIVSLRDAYAAVPFRSPELRSALIEAMRSAASDAMASAVLHTDSIDADSLVSFYDRVGTDRDRMESKMPRAFHAADSVYVAAMDHLDILEAFDLGERTATEEAALNRIRITAQDLRMECATSTVSGAPHASAAADDSLRFDIADVFHFLSRLANGKDVLAGMIGEPQIAKLQRSAEALEARRSAAASLRACADLALEAIESERG